MKGIKASKKNKKIKLIVDGNLLARKSFYKFNNLSTEIPIEDLRIISSDLANFKLSELKSKEEDFEREIKEEEKVKTEKIIAKGSGESLSINKNSRIDRKVRELKLKNQLIRIRTGVLYGFLRSIISIKEKIPEIKEIILCYDPVPNSEIPHRLAHYSGYKNRVKDSETEKNFDQEMSLLANFFYKSGFLQVRTTRFEADDLLQYFSHKIYKGDKCLVLTSDHDLLQIIDKTTSLIDIGKNSGITSLDVFTEKYGFHPRRYRDVLTLAGCNTDNVKGVKGIGEDTAIDLVRNFSLPDLLRKIKSGKKEDISDISIRALTALQKEDKEFEFKNLSLSRQLTSLYGLHPKFEKDIIAIKSDKKPVNSFEFLKRSLKLLKFQSFLQDSKLNLLKEMIFGQKDL